LYEDFKNLDNAGKESKTIFEAPGDDEDFIKAVKEDFRRKK